jgi:hypothetical protein
MLQYSWTYTHDELINNMVLVVSSNLFNIFSTSIAEKRKNKEPDIKKKIAGRKAIKWNG